jgi:signal peptidase I
LFSLSSVAMSDQTPGGAAPGDLRARIAARVAERRRPGLAPDARPTGVGSGGRHRSGPRSPLRAAILRLLILVVVTGLVVVLLRTFVVASFYIPSGSMETTLHGCPGCEADMVMVDKLSYRFGSVSRGDVVVFDRPPLAPTEDHELIKRVIGLPGDTVSAHDGQVYIGDRPLSESYVDRACAGTADFPPVQVPAGRYFMMGDNRCDSLDSRVFGTIARSALVGRAFAVIWPVKHLRWL